MAKTFAGDYLLAIRATSPLSGMGRIAPFFVVTRYAAVLANDDIFSETAALLCAPGFSRAHGKDKGFFFYALLFFLKKLKCWV